MWPGRVVLESITVQVAANAGTLLSTVQNVHLLCPLTVLCTLPVKVKVPTESAILKGTVTTSTKERCAWDSGSEIVSDMETLTLIRVGIQCPGSSSKKFPELRLKSQAKPVILHKRLNGHP